LPERPPAIKRLDSLVPQSLAGDAHEARIEAGDEQQVGVGEHDGPFGSAAVVSTADFDPAAQSTFARAGRGTTPSRLAALVELNRRNRARLELIRITNTSST
jgi:hypothetical protein